MIKRTYKPRGYIHLTKDGLTTLCSKPVPKGSKIYEAQEEINHPPIAEIRCLHCLRVEMKATPSTILTNHRTKG